MVQRDYILPKLPVALPTSTIPQFVDINALGEHFQSVLNSLDENAFVQDAVWRDTFIMTGTFRTFYSSQSIFTAWQETAKNRRPTSFAVDGISKVRKSWIEIGFTFIAEGTPATTGYSYVSVVPDSHGHWKIWAMRTIMEQIEGQPNVDKLEAALLPIVPRRVDSPVSDGNNAQPHATSVIGSAPDTNGDHNGEITHSNGFTQSPELDTDFFECIVVGGGQAGLGSGGRLKALGISYVVLEKNAEVGDSWASRYDLTRCKWSSASCYPLV